MIYFLLATGPQISAFNQACKEKKIAGKIIDLRQKHHLDELYRAKGTIETIVATCRHPRISPPAWLDILNAWGARVPVIALYHEGDLPHTQNHHVTSPLLWQPEAKLSTIFNALQKLTSLGLKNEGSDYEPIPIFNPAYAIQLLQKNSYLSLLCIDTTDFNKIAISSGRQTYNRLRAFFQKLLFTLWGKTGSFRREDQLFHSAQNKNLYYILLHRPRAKTGIPNPGQLEGLSERILQALQIALWQEFSQQERERIIPIDLNAIPHFYLGYDTIIHNPCIDPYDAIDMLLQTSRHSALIQQQRVMARQREFVLMLIQNEAYLTSQYQGIFASQHLSVAAVKKAQQHQSLAPLAKNLVGFEGLIRPQREKIESLFRERGPFYFDLQDLGPDVLFTMARLVKLNLELDQACMRLVVKGFKGLPGRLTANILPRNFYFIDQLLAALSLPAQITFEVSEAEAIKNYQLLLQAKKNIARKNITIAIDDFGKGYAGFNRIIAMSPDMIKLDRTLLQGIDQDEVRKAYVSGIVKAAGVSKTLVLAEGVETIAEMRTLQAIGVDLFQGNLFHRPESKEQIRRKLGF